MTAPLMAQLADVRRRRDIPLETVARQIGRYPATVSGWECSRSCPPFAVAVAYARTLGARVALQDDDCAVIAEGLRILEAFPVVRRAAGLRQRDLAARLGVGTTAVAMFETRHSRRLSAVETYAEALGLHLAVRDRGAATGLGVYVVQRRTDGLWVADCVNSHCGFGAHGVAEENSQARANAQAARHREEIRRELAEAEQRAGREATVDWRSRAQDAERRLSRTTLALAALRRYARHTEECAEPQGGACDCGLTEALGSTRGAP